MGVKVTLHRHDNHGEIVTRTFDRAEHWEFTDVGQTRTLLLTAEGEYDFIAEFPVDVVESVEFV